MKTHNFAEHERVVKIVLTNKEEALVPVYAKDGDAGADVRCVSGTEMYTENFIAQITKHISFKDEKMEEDKYKAGDYLIAPRKTGVFDLGFRIQLRPGWEMQVRSRSGMAKRGLVVANAPGTIDSGYRGPCMVLLHNNTPHWRIIKPGTRVAQFVLKRAPQAVFELTTELDDSDRGEGGFGSTGTQ